MLPPYLQIKPPIMVLGTHVVVNFNMSRCARIVLDKILLFTAIVRIMRTYLPILYYSEFDKTVFIIYTYYYNCLVAAVGPVQKCKYAF